MTDQTHQPKVNHMKDSEKGLLDIHYMALVADLPTSPAVLVVRLVELLNTQKCL